jgi:hypothetical protein
MRALALQALYGDNASGSRFGQAREKNSTPLHFPLAPCSAKNYIHIIETAQRAPPNDTI